VKKVYAYLRKLFFWVAGMKHDVEQSVGYKKRLLVLPDQQPVPGFL
jgi:hypothetical protein